MTDTEQQKGPLNGGPIQSPRWRRCTTHTAYNADENARLIQSAPDLLEALKRITAEAAKSIYPKPDVGPDHPYSILKQAEAAIAKALGEQK